MARNAHLTTTPLSQDPSQPLKGTAGDRRSHPRRAAVLGCKVLIPAASRYLTARTDDVSASGAAVEIETTQPLSAGQSVEIGLCWNNSGVIRSRDLIEATVVRASPAIGDRQRIALRFARIQSESEHTASQQA
ncbi:MAG: PilZ domain-containing protein, partial [Planctomycetota bacterium]